MKKKYISTIILFVALGLFITLEKLGFTLISKAVGVAFTIASLILSISNIKAMNKKLLATVLTITITPMLLIIYSVFMTNINIKLMYFGFICLLISFPISLVIICIYRKSDRNKLN